MLLMSPCTQTNIIFETLRKHIFLNAELYNVPAVVIAAIIYQESIKGSKTIEQAIYASRAEPQFFLRYIFNKPLKGWVPKKNELPTEATERQDRARSWGLMQILGSTARELGYSGQYLTSLCDPAINILWGTKILVHYKKLEANNLMEAIRRYNGRKKGDYTYYYQIKKHIDNEIPLSVFNIF